jgi:hypothetical protein
MPDSNETVALREALQFLIASDMPMQHKRVLMETVTDALKAGQVAESRMATVQHVSLEWQPKDTEIVTAFLQNKVARSWQHADETLMWLASELHRRPDDVRTKAIELGLGMGIDYGLAKKTQSVSGGGLTR